MCPGSLHGPFGRRGVRAPTALEAARFDRFAIRERGVPEPALMENAGRQAALLIQHLFPRGTVTALVGSGNNGGDALVCLRALAAWGRPVTAVVVGKRPSPDPVLHGWDLPAAEFDPADDHDSALTGLLGSAGVVVDGLLGTGIRGAPRANCAVAIEAANRAEAPVVALDTPSGVDGTSGEVAGSAVKAALTIAFGWPKLGTLLYPGRACCGRIVAVEIGFPPAGEEQHGWARLVTSGWAARNLPRRDPMAHKNAVGSVAILAGSAMPGAAVLAARSAFRTGAGLVRVCASRRAGAVVGEVPEAIFADAGDPGALHAAVQASDALAVGPGLGHGETAAQQLETALAARADRPLVIDADALTLLARGACGGLRALTGTGVVITPHPGEMARLAGTPVSEVQADRIGTAGTFAARRGAVTLLKGAPSLVADPGGGLLVSTAEATSALAVAGMGDVLTGAVGSLLAQGADPVTACGLALHITGRSAAASGLRASLMPSDVVEGIGAVVRRLSGGSGAHPAGSAHGARDAGGAAATGDADAVRESAETDLPFPFVSFDQASPR